MARCEREQRVRPEVEVVGERDVQILSSREMVGAVQDRGQIAVAALLGHEADRWACAISVIGHRPSGSAPVPGLARGTECLTCPLGERPVVGVVDDNNVGCAEPGDLLQNPRNAGTAANGVELLGR